MVKFNIKTSWSTDYEEMVTIEDILKLLYPPENLIEEKVARICAVLDVTKEICTEFLADVNEDESRAKDLLVSCGYRYKS
jgi:hypothetical protein